MTKKAAAPEVKKPVDAKPAEVEKKEKVHTSKPGINPFVQQHPAKPGRPGARRR